MLEVVLVDKLMAQKEKRLGVLKDTRMFPRGYFNFVRNGKSGRERISPIIGKNAGQIVARMQSTPAEEKVRGSTSIKLYGKPEECMAYYVINEKYNGSVSY